MRTSNKILIGLLLATIFLFTGLFAAVRIKYNNGSIVKNNEGGIEQKKADQPIKGPVKRVSLYMLSDVMIVPSDSLRLKIWDYENSKIKYRIQDGVLIIEGADTTGLRPGDHLEPAYQHIELFIPRVDSIYAFDSRINLHSIMDSGEIGPSYNFQLEVSHLNVNKVNFNHNSPTMYGRISVNATMGSDVTFNAGVHIDEADLRLHNAVFEEHCTFDKLRIQTDSAASLRIQGGNLRKAIITSIE